MPILYFYSKDCTNCVDQGELFDRFKSDGEDINITVLVFPIDLDFEDDSINLIKRYYNVSEVPTTIIKQEIFHGVLVNNTEMKELI